MRCAEGESSGKRERERKGILLYRSICFSLSLSLPLSLSPFLPSAALTLGDALQLLVAVVHRAGAVGSVQCGAVRRSTAAV